MYNNLNIGKNAAGVLAAPAFAPISRIALLVDDENEYLSGDDSGRTLEVTCPYGSQAMADDLLAQLKGYSYQPMTAQDALLDPAAEIGDGVTVGGVYTILAQIDRLFDMHCAADIAAPGEEELESEYTFQTQEKRLERKLAQTRSLIAKTAEEVKISVEELDGKYTALSVTLDGVTITDPDGTTKIKGSSIDTTTLNVQNINFTGVIKWDDLSDDAKSHIGDGSGITKDEASDIVSTYIDRWRVSSPTLEGSSIYGGAYYDSEECGKLTLSYTIGSFTYPVLTFEDLENEVSLLSVHPVKYISAGIAASLKMNGVSLLSVFEDGTVRVSGDWNFSNATVSNISEIVTSDNLYLEGGGASLAIGDGANAYIWAGGHIFPDSDSYCCGNNNYPWSIVSATDVYVDGAAVTSDRNKKHDIVYDLGGYDALFDALRPVGYKLNNGKSDRVHIGMIAQEVEEAVTLCGMTGQDFGAVVRETAENGTERYYLRYMEFIGLLIDQVQKLKARMGQLEARV